VHFEAHAGVGWLLGAAPALGDRRLRAWCVTAAVLPDIDAVSFLFGPAAYSQYHHTFGHNVFLGALVVAAAAWAHRDRPARHRVVASLLVAVAFASHILSDMKLSAYEVYLFWPFSRAGYEFTPNLGLGSPVNSLAVYASLAVVLAIGFWRKRTPLDLLSPNLDTRIVRALGRRSLSCATCGAPCGDGCDQCGRPACSRHGRIGRGVRLTCPECSPTPGG
jgi:hypothetical protein